MTSGYASGPQPDEAADVDFFGGLAHGNAVTTGTPSGLDPWETADLLGVSKVNPVALGFPEMDLGSHPSWAVADAIMGEARTEPVYVDVGFGESDRIDLSHIDNLRHVFGDQPQAMTDVDTAPAYGDLVANVGAGPASDNLWFFSQVECIEQASHAEPADLVLHDTFGDLWK